MKLVYEKKKSKEEIFKKSEIYKDKILANTFENFILQGENFKALSVLLNNGYRNKIDLVYIDIISVAKIHIFAEYYACF